jgi:hypothetical protein
LTHGSLIRRKTTQAKLSTLSLSLYIETLSTESSLICRLTTSIIYLLSGHTHCPSLLSRLLSGLISAKLCLLLLLTQLLVGHKLLLTETLTSLKGLLSSATDL